MQLPRVSAGRVGVRVGGKEPPAAGSARSAERGAGPQPVAEPALGAEIEM